MSETKREVSTIRNEQIVARYRAGESLDEIGTDFGISRERVRQILERAGCPRRAMTVTEKFLKSRRKPKELISGETLLKLYEREKLSLNKIRRHLKTTNAFIFNCLDHHRIERRSSEENKRLLSRRPEMDKEALRKLYVEDDLSAAAIAETFDYARSTVKSKLSVLGIRKSDSKPREVIRQEKRS